MGALALAGLIGAMSSAAHSRPAVKSLAEVRLQEKARAAFPGELGAAFALRVGQQTYYFSMGWANREREIPVTSDSLFNLASVSKVFDAALLALSAQQREVLVHDPISKYVPEIT